MSKIKITAQCIRSSDFAEKCHNCTYLGIWLGDGENGNNRHLCNLMEAATYLHYEPCDMYKRKLAK